MSSSASSWRKSRAKESLIPLTQCRRQGKVSSIWLSLPLFSNIRKSIAAWHDCIGRCANYCCDKSQETDNPKSGGAEGFQRAIGKPFGRARRRDSPCNNENPVTWECARSSPEGDRKALWSPPQRRNPCLRKHAAMFERQAVRSRPSGATLHRCWKEQLGGASAEAQSYW